MIKLFSLKQQGREGGSQQSTHKATAAHLRVQKGKNCDHFMCVIVYLL